MSDPSDLSWWFGSSPEKYRPDPNASRLNGAYGSTQALQGQMNAAAPTMNAAGLDTKDYRQDRGLQLGALGQIASAAQGQGPSAAGMAATAQRDANLSQAAALQSGRRGAGAGAGIRAANNTVTMGNQQAGQTEAIGRANEMATARGQQLGALGQLAGQDVNVANANAGYQQAANTANLNANLANRGMNLQAMGQLSDQARAEMLARMQQEGYQVGNLNPGGGGVFPSLVGAGATLGAAALLKDGAYVDRPTFAIIGEAGPEMVIPLSPGHEGMQRSALRVLHDIERGGRRRDVPDGHVRMMADGGIVDPNYALSMMRNPATQQGGGGQLMGPGQRVVPDYRSQGERTGQAVAGALQQFANLYLAKAMGDRQRSDAEAKERARNGGVTDEQAKTDPQAAQTKAAFQAKMQAITDARGQLSPGQYYWNQTGIPQAASKGTHSAWDSLVNYFKDTPRTGPPGLNYLNPTASSPSSGSL